MACRYMLKTWILLVITLVIPVSDMFVVKRIFVHTQKPYSYLADILLLVHVHVSNCVQEIFYFEKHEI